MLDLLKRFGRSLISHPHYKLLAVIIALTAWWYVQASQVSTIQVRVPVDWVTPPELVTVEPLPPTVLVTLEGSRNALRRVPADEVLLPVDLGDVATEVGAHSLELNPHALAGLPASVTCTSIRPSILSFTLDEVVSRSVTLSPVVVGQPQEGTMVVETRLEPSVIEVRGPRVALANLVTLDTLPINVSGLRHDKRFQIGIDLPRSVEMVGTDEVEARVDVEAQTESRVISEVPLYVRGQTGWISEPGVVRVRLEGPAASLREIRERDVVAQVFLPDAPTRGAYTVPFGPDEGVRLEITTGSEAVEAVEVEPRNVRVMRP